MSNIVHQVKLTADPNEAIAKIKEYGDVIIGTTSKVKGYTERFTGSVDALLKKAHDYTATVQKIGGASQLTTRDQQAVNKVVSEAIAYYQRIGQVAPTAMRELQAATASTAKDTSAWVASFKGALGALGVGFGAAAVLGQVKNFAGEILRMGDEIVRMSDQTGMSTDAVQELGFIASQTGVSIDGLVGAVQNLQQRIGSGDKGLGAGLKALNLNLDDLRTLAPEQQMYVIADAIAKIQDPTTQARIAAELFGKSWKEILPALKSGMGELASETTKLSAEQVRALDDAGDALEEYSRKLKVYAANALNYGIAGAKVVWGGVQAALGNPAGAAASLQSVIQAAARRALGWAGDQTGGVVDFTSGKPSAGAPPPGPSDEEKKWLEDYQKKVAALFGKEDLARAREYVRMVGDLSNLSRISAERQEEVNKAVKAGIDYYERLGQRAPKAMERLYVATLKLQEVSSRVMGPGEIPQGFSPLGLGTAPIDEKQLAQLAHIEQYSYGVADAYALLTQKGSAFYASKPFDAPAKEAHALDQELDRLSQAFAELAQISGGSLSAVVRDLGQLVASAKTAKDSVKSIGAGSEQWGKAGAMNKLEGGLSIASGVMGLVGSAVQIGSMIKNLFGPSAEYTAWKEAEKQAGQQYADLKASLLEKYGNVEQVAALDAQLGTNLAQLLSQAAGAGGYGAQNLKDLQAVVKQFDATYAVAQKYGVTAVKDQSAELLKNEKLLEQFGKAPDQALKLMADDFNALLRTAQKTGDKLPATLQPMVRKLAEMGLISEDVQKSLGTLAPDAATVQGLASKYGLGAQYLGQGTFDARAKTLSEDYQALVAGGANRGFALQSMQDELGAYVKDVLAGGGTLSTDVQWMVQELIRGWGGLKDAEGNLFSDLGGLKFAQPIEDATKAQTDALVAELEKLFGGVTDLPAAIAANLADLVGGTGGGAPGGKFWNPETQTFDRMHVGGAVTAHGGIYLGRYAARMASVLTWPRAHQGLAIDEVPLIGQTGEVMWSRSDVSRWGGIGAVDAMRRGGPGARAGTSQPVQLSVPVVLKGREIARAMIDDLFAELERQGAARR